MIRAILVWLGWPQKKPAQIVTRRRFQFEPWWNITPYELALAQPLLIMSYEKWYTITTNEMWQCVPGGCSRHFSVWERDFEVREGHEDVGVGMSRPSFEYVVLCEEPNSTIWEGCARRPGNDYGSAM